MCKLLVCNRDGSRKVRGVFVLKDEIYGKGGLLSEVINIMINWWIMEVKEYKIYV